MTTKYIQTSHLDNDLKVVLEQIVSGLSGQVTPAAHVDPSTGTVADIVAALVAAGLMAAS